VERRLASNTIESYARDLVILQRFAARLDRSVVDLAPADLEAFVRGMMAEGRSPRSVSRTVACTRGFYRFLVLEGLVTRNPADSLRPPKAWKSLPSFLSVADIDSLLAAPDTSTPR